MNCSIVTDDWPPLTPPPPHLKCCDKYLLKVNEVIKSSYKHFRKLQLKTHTHTLSAQRTLPETKTKVVCQWCGSSVDKIPCTCICVCVYVCWGDAGAVRATEEEAGLLPFELDLEKKAVFPSCQISLTAMPRSSSQHKLVWQKPWAIHLFTESIHANSIVLITHLSEITSMTGIINSDLYWSHSHY